MDTAKPGSGPEEFFKSDEAHIRSLAWDAKGNLIAGSDGSGLVYRINPRGKGTCYLKRRGARSRRWRWPPTARSTRPAWATRPTILCLRCPCRELARSHHDCAARLSAGGERQHRGSRRNGYLCSAAKGQAPRKLWSSKDDIVYALAAQPDGLLALTGNRGHIFRIQTDGSLRRRGPPGGAAGPEPRAAERADGLLIGTGNTGKLFTLGAAEKHEYASDVLDAGALARFGRVEVEPGSTGL